jgi:dienelactone hydrolase
MAHQRLDRDFQSDGLRCAAWLYLPEDVPKPPIVVMSHGFSAYRDMIFPRYAERFADAGLAVLLFDYRNLGDSEGSPRDLVDPLRHVEDLQTAIRFVRGLPEVDGARLGLFGSSFGGGHVITAAARDAEVSAIVSQVPFVGGADAAQTPWRYRARLAWSFFRDKLASRFGRVYCVPAVGGPNEFGLLASPDAQDFVDLLPEGSAWPNRIPARVLPNIMRYRPMDEARRVRCPVLMVLAEHDQLVPAAIAKQCAERIADCELVSLDCEHFEVYRDERLPALSARYADFFRKHL